MVDAVWQWQTDNVNWLDEFFDLAQRFPSGRDAMVRRLSVSPGRNAESVINLTVNVRDQAVIAQLGNQLRDANHDVRNSDVSEQTSSADYPWQFETRITVRKREVDDYRKNAPADKPKGDIAASTMANLENE